MLAEISFLLFQANNIIHILETHFSSNYSLFYLELSMLFCTLTPFKQNTDLSVSHLKMKQQKTKVDKNLFHPAPIQFLPLPGCSLYSLLPFISSRNCISISCLNSMSSLDMAFVINSLLFSPAYVMLGTTFCWNYSHFLIINEHHSFIYIYFFSCTICYCLSLSLYWDLILPHILRYHISPSPFCPFRRGYSSFFLGYSATTCPIHIGVIRVYSQLKTAIIGSSLMV